MKPTERRARNTGQAQGLRGEPDGTDSRRVCRCRFVVDACLVRGRCVGMPRGRTRLQRICPCLRHHRRQAFRVAAMRAPQPAAGLYTCVVPSRWFAHHLKRARNGHAPALAAFGSLSESTRSGAQATRLGRSTGKISGHLGHRKDPSPAMTARTRPLPTRTSIIRPQTKGRLPSFILSDALDQ
jgi:hypothetical protein